MQHRAIAEQVREWRKLRGLSQRALAERAEVGYVLVARLELGQTDPRLSTLHRLAEALGIDVMDLLTGPLEWKRPARKRAREK
ncbi:MAG: helix-turn-helix domain-containing protein [Candidatus Methylomirabilales bacterium]